MSLLNTHSQIIWSIFLEIPSNKTNDFDMKALINKMENDGVLIASNKNSTKKLVDGVNENRSISLYPQTFSLSGQTKSEMRTYAQKLNKQAKYQIDFQDIIKLQNKSFSFTYAFDILCFDPNIIVIEAKTLPFKENLFVDDFQELASLPIANTKSNLYNYIMRLCRFFCDWQAIKPFEQKKKTTNISKLKIKPTIILGFENEFEAATFKNEKKREAAGILTRDKKWKSWNSKSIEKITSKNYAMSDGELLLIDKQGILATGVFNKDIKRYSSIFSVVRLMEIAYTRGMILDSASTKEDNLALKIACDDIKYPIRITHSVRLKNIWMESLILEFLLKEKLSYIENKVLVNLEKENGKLIGNLIVNNINNSSVGVFNSGSMNNIQSISINIKGLEESGMKEIAQAIRELAEVVDKSLVISEHQRKEILEQINELSKQANLPPDKRLATSVIKSVFISLGSTIGTVAGIAQIWSTWGPVISKFFNF